jgi:predicted transcriptional regulator
MTEITDYITNDYKAIDSEATIASVQDFFDELNFSHFPVVDEGIYIGSIASEDSETFDSFKKVFDYRYSLEGFFAREKMIWLDVLEVFAKSKSNLVPVLNENNTYLGYYEIRDVLNFFHETPFLQESGGIIVVQKKTLEYSIGGITQIIESNNGKILGIFVSESNFEYTQVTIKISSGVLNEIIQSFRRYDYEVISEHLEDDYINTLKERSDYLEKYLNI